MGLLYFIPILIPQTPRAADSNIKQKRVFYKYIFFIFEFVKENEFIAPRRCRPLARLAADSATQDTARGAWTGVR